MNLIVQASHSLSESRVDGLHVDYWALTFDFTFSSLSRLRKKSLATLKRKSKVLRYTPACSVGTVLDLFGSHSPLDILTPKYDGFTCCPPCASSIDDYHLLFSPPKPPPKFSSWYMKSFLGKLYETTERNLRISSVWICQKVHKQKLQCLSCSWGAWVTHWRKGRGAGTSHHVRTRSPLPCQLTLVAHTEAKHSQGEGFTEQRVTERSQKLGKRRTCVHLNIRG